jgi:alkylation response protein AidB-like acyl-CoA dehydrogenase
VSGTKKWITQGNHADYFVCATRTSDIKGMGGISLLLLERDMEGLETRPIKTKYSASAGTALVILENVKVPVENLIGGENGGFMCIMYNFNHERWFITVYILGVCRSIIDECFKWAMQRRAFDQRLMDQGVIRNKMAKMIGSIEACTHWVDQITFQMNNMEYDMQAMRLAGMTSLAKFQATRVAEMIADESVQIFGGRGITKTGMGKYIERFHSGYKFASILGGSEEILGDMAMKMAMKSYPRDAKL